MKKKNDLSDKPVVGFAKTPGRSKIPPCKKKSRLKDFSHYLCVW